eukprot:scaffold207_cov409-Prasinococcus_capsulatus_cf.AAC.133
MKAATRCAARARQRSVISPSAMLGPAAAECAAPAPGAAQLASSMFLWGLPERTGLFVRKVAGRLAAEGLGLLRAALETETVAARASEPCIILA